MVDLSIAMLVYQRVSTNGEPCNKQRLHQLTMTYFMQGRLVTGWKQRNTKFPPSIAHQWDHTPLDANSNGHDVSKGGLATTSCVICQGAGETNWSGMSQDDWPHITSITYTMWFNVWNRIAETSICDGWSWLSPLSNVVLPMKKTYFQTRPCGKKSDAA